LTVFFDSHEQLAQNACGVSDEKYPRELNRVNENTDSPYIQEEKKWEEMNHALVEVKRNIKSAVGNKCDIS